MAATRDTPPPLHARFVDLLLEKLERRKPDGYDIYLTQSANLSIESENQELDTYQEARTAGVSLRWVKDHHVGFSYATAIEPDEAAVDRLIRNAEEAARWMDPEPLFSLSPRPNAPWPWLNEFDPTLEKRGRSEKIETAVALEKAARSHDNRIRAVRNATYREVLQRIRFLNSSGFDADYASTFCSISVMAVGGENEESEIGWDMEFAPFFERLDPWTVGKRAAQRAVDLLGGCGMTTYAGAVILDSPVAAEFLEILSESILYENVFKKKSGLIGRRG